MTIDELMQLIHQSYYKKPCVILGDTDFMLIWNKVKSSMTYTEATPNQRQDFFYFAGAKVYSNQTIGTEGYFIGEERQIEMLLNYFREGWLRNNCVEITSPNGSHQFVMKP